MKSLNTYTFTQSCTLCIAASKWHTRSIVQIASNVTTSLNAGRKNNVFDNGKDDIQKGWVEYVRVREACLACEDNFDLLNEKEKEEKKKRTSRPRKTPVPYQQAMSTGSG
jgi:hypothetical protein